jgi:DNA-binding response OmpR family regulator
MNGEPHLLVVDDDARIRDLLSRYLRTSGFRVTTAGNAADARQKLAGLDFDCLVLDVMMPGEDGRALTADLKRTRPVPILLLTAMAEADDRIRGLESGADDYLVKPFEPRELVLRIRNVLQRERFAFRGRVQQALAAIGGAGALHDIAVVDELAQYAPQALLGDLQDVEEIRDAHAGMAVHEMQHAVMRAAEADAREDLVGVADEIAIGEKQQLDQVVSGAFRGAFALRKPRR